MRRLIAYTALLLSSVIPLSALAADWELDSSHSRVGFAIKHMMITDVQGEFRDFALEVKADEKDVTRSSVVATIKVASIDTREARRDGHLKGADFFDAEKHPAMAFRSRSIAREGEGRYKMIGDLTIRGITREVALDLAMAAQPMKDPFGNTRMGVQAKGTIDRRDFGLTWNKALEAGGVLVGDEVRIVIDAELIRK